jgi:hypothetical protein
MRMSSHLAQRRYRMIVTRGAAAAACAVLAAACGSTTAPGAGSGSGSGSVSTTSAAKISLIVTFAASPATAAKHYTLKCEPAGGTAPDAATACSKLLTSKNLFGPKPAHVMCPMILASAARATVSGTYLGKKVHETVLDGGCDLARYQQLRHIFN